MVGTATASTLAQPTDAVCPAEQIWRRHPEIWVAVVLWIASNAFVIEVSKFATWEGSASYSSSADLCKWDCNWFGSVLQFGYFKIPQVGTGWANWGFHPIFPLTAYPFRYWLNFSVPLSIVLASKVALLFAIYGFLLMIGDQADTDADRFRAGSLVAFNPYLIYAHAGYSEPLYFALLAFAFYFASRGRWIASGLAGAFLSATRIVGFLFSISYAILLLRDLEWRLNWRKIDLNRLISFLLCPLGTAIYMLYLYHHTGDALAQIHVHVAFADGKGPGNPVRILWLSLTAHHWLRVWGLMVLASLVASVWLFKLRKPELGIYLAFSVVIPMTAGFAPYGMARYIWWQPPFLCAIYWILKRHTAWWVVYVAFAAGLASFMIVAWLSGRSFAA